MNGDSEALVASAAPAPASVDRGWRLALLLLSGLLLAVLAIHWTTVVSIVSIWWRSETFAHGFLIVPITLGLIWRQRHVLAAMKPSPDVLGIVMLALAGAAWLAAYAGEVLVLKQLALVATIWGVVLASVGLEIARVLAFPLGFLILGVPMGEALIPPLMTWTADFTVTALRLSGIPVFRDGTFFFSIPSGNWSIVEGCSGVRYLIASFTVGVLFAYLSYRKLWKRLLFAGLSIAVPVIANGLRAYMIVMIAHLSGNKLAHGVDHFVYGWVFFGLVMLLLFWIGSSWRDSDVQAAASPRDRADSGRPNAPAGALAYALGALAVAAAWPAYAAYLDRDESFQTTVLTLDAPAGAGGWIADAASITDWRPHYDPASATVFQVYRKGGSAVALHLGYYRHQRRGAQLVNSQNLMVVQKHPVWTDVGSRDVKEASGTGALQVRETELRGAKERLLIWDWFRIAGHDLTNPYAAKALLAWEKLTGRRDDGTAIIVATVYSDPTRPPRATLAEFTRDMLPSIDAALGRVEGNLVAGRQ